jgi:quercetin dioxygenase-like cupin family protein
LFALVATLPFGSVLADAPKSKNTRVTLVYQHELPNVLGKSIKGVLVEYGPGGYSLGHTPAFTRPFEGAIRSQINEGAVTTYKAEQSFTWTSRRICCSHLNRSLRRRPLRRKHLMPLLH